MVHGEKVYELAESVGINGGIGDKGLRIGTACYDAGMISILRLFAEKQIVEDDPSTFKESDMTKSLAVTTQEKFDKLFKTLDEEQQKMFLEYEDEQTSYLGCSREDYYIQGFISGFRFLMREIKYGTGDELLK
ncbi:DUF6809 family protein [Cytobacillus horneckiae]|uniref:Uncharacterized protein n=1 Tax=Cytobacillus horneckiae TaxID=549687 RepID=A0A2N0ZB61_9BACI|nr:DUF6809 family protein [Cytobacillus horneckiae]MEC1155512.1 hypothetical protein [Cytobacillus horneckiae]MED2936831.1 hypothetical protein [Cytobacillus horneckiae]PKG26748.1 hypothetical protein CWS20_22475 [Cytobacillus horneckiae]